MEEEVCCVCDTAFVAFDRRMYDNAIRCPNGHDLCLSCMAKVCQPGYGQPKKNFSGILFKCPMCRHVSQLGPLGILQIMKGSIKEVLQYFRCECHLKSWLRNSRHVKCKCHTANVPPPPPARLPERRSTRIARKVQRRSARLQGRIAME